MSVRKHTTESLRSQEPFKKRFKIQVTPVELCKVVIENNSSDDENTETGEDQTSSGEDRIPTDSSEDSDDEIIEDNINNYWFEKNPKDEENIDYNECIGLQVTPRGPQPRDFFNLLMKKSLYNLIIKNTNAYISHASKNTNDPKTSLWKPLKEDDLQKFLGLLFLMGVIQLPDINLYWSEDILFNFPSFRQIMSLERFVSIFRSLRFCEDSVFDLADPLKKIGLDPLISYFNTLMESVYNPQKDLVMNRPIQIADCHKAGRVKVFTLCERNGMVLKYLVRTVTKRKQARSFVDRYSAAKELLEGKLGKGHSVYMGGYFTSIPMIESLKAENTYATGALNQKNQKRCEKLWASFSEENYFSRFNRNGVCLLKWKEKRKEMVCISSEIDMPLTKTIDPQKAKNKPLALGVLESYLQTNNWLEEPIISFQIGKEKLKWNEIVVLQIMNILLMNSYHLYNQCLVTKKMSLLKFKLSLIKTLLYSNIAVEDNLPSQSTEGLAKPHVLDYVGRNDKGYRKRKRCKYCITERGVRIDSYYHCITCDNQPGFCLGQCFIKYHKYDLPQ